MEENQEEWNEDLSYMAEDLDISIGELEEDLSYVVEEIDETSIDANEPQNLSYSTEVRPCTSACTNELV